MLVQLVSLIHFHLEYVALSYLVTYLVTVWMVMGLTYYLYYHNKK